MNETNQLRSELERMTLVYQLFEKEKSDHEATKQQLDAANRREQVMREALHSASAAFKKMADGLDRVKAAGESACELGVEVAATFRKHQAECDAALQPDAGTLSADCRANQTTALSQTSPGAGSAAISQSALQPDAGK